MSTAKAGAVVNGAERFFGWWFGELAGLVPARLRAAVAPPGDGIIAAFEGDSVTFYLCERGSSRQLCPAMDTAILDGQAVQALLGKRAKHLPLVVTIGADISVRQKAELPLAAQNTVRDVAGFEMDRLTPFSREEVYFDCRILGQRAEAKKLDVEIILSPKARIDAILDACKRWGLSPDRVDAAGAARGTAEGLTLLNLRSRRGRLSAGKAVFFMLTVSVCAIGAAALWFEMSQKESALGDLKRRLAVARADAAQATQLRRSLATAEKSGAYLAELKSGQPTVLALLNEATALLPDDSWLLSFRLDGERLALSGYSPQSSALIALFEKSPRFSGAAFEDPIVQVPDSALEKFTLSLTVNGLDGAQDEEASQ